MQKDRKRDHTPLLIKLLSEPHLAVLVTVLVQPDASSTLFQHEWSGAHRSRCLNGEVRICKQGLRPSGLLSELRKNK